MSIISTNKELDKYSYIQHMLVDSGGEVTEEIQQEIDSLDSDVKGRIEWLADQYRDNVLKAAWYKAKIEEFTKSRKSRINSIEYWKNKIDSTMKESGKVKLFVGDHDISFRKSTCLEVSEDIIDHLEEKYINTVTTESPMKQLIRSDIEAGILDLPEDVAKIVTKANLQIK